MSYINKLFSRPLIFAICMSYAVVGCAASEVAQTGSSTSKTEPKAAQSSDDKTTSSVEIIKTPDGQKVITRSGGSTDVTIQSNSSTKQVTTSKIIMLLRQVNLAKQEVLSLLKKNLKNIL